MFACFRLRSYSASMFIDSCLTIFPCCMYESSVASNQPGSRASWLSRTSHPRLRAPREQAHLLNGKLLIGLDLDLAGFLERLLLDEGDLWSWRHHRDGRGVRIRPKARRAPAQAQSGGSGARGSAGEPAQMSDVRGTDHLLHLAEDLRVDAGARCGGEGQLALGVTRRSRGHSLLNCGVQRAAARDSIGRTSSSLSAGIVTGVLVL